MKPLDLAPIVHRLTCRALADEHYESVFDDVCNALVDAGLPLLRANLGMQILHPLVASVDMTWSREHGFEITPHSHTTVPRVRWLDSPFYWMLTNKYEELRQKLSDREGEHEFGVFDDFRRQGATDYLALLTGFGDPETAFERRDGILTSWVCDAPNGFTDDQLDTLRTLQPHIGLVAKLSKYEYTSRNVMAAYLGEDAGRRVLEGQIRLGDVEHIPAVIWFCDLRDSTAMAERLPVEDFLETVNAYFDCTAGAVLDHGGEVLRFIGDAVLAVFPMTANESPKASARQALRASEQAKTRLATLNQRRAERAQEQITFGLGLHRGELLLATSASPVVSSSPSSAGPLTK